MNNIKKYFLPLVDSFLKTTCYITFMLENDHKCGNIVNIQKKTRVLVAFAFLSQLYLIFMILNDQEYLRRIYLTFEREKCISKVRTIDYLYVSINYNRQYVLFFHLISYLCVMHLFSI